MARKHHRKKYRRPRFRRRTAPGASPGTVTAPPGAQPSVVRVMAYNDQELVEEEVSDLKKLDEHLEHFAVTWINVDGLADSKLIKKLGQQFALHPLSLEDAVNVHQRSKLEPYEQYVFLVARMANLRDPRETEQVSFFIGDRFLITFQERPGDCLEPVRQRIRAHSGKIRKRGTDYLTYAILDSVIDSYFPLVEYFADQLDELEDEVIVSQHPDVIARLHEIRNDLHVIRRAVRPHRSAVNELIRDAPPPFTEETLVYLRDCSDHTIQLIELLEVYREMCSDLRDYYLSSVSNRMNEIMKVLTVIATIFIPLSFVAGVYGMNFDTSSPWNMPELEWRYGYLYSLGIMAAIAGGLLAYFYRKGWLR